MRLSEIVLAALSVSGYVAAYSDMGHRTVALLARKYLSDDAVAYYNDLLANTQGFEWDDAATWADTVKRKRPYSSTWHFISELSFIFTFILKLFNNEVRRKGRRGREKYSSHRVQACTPDGL